MEPARVKVATTREELKQKVLIFSLCTRVFILVFSFASNATVPDHNAGVFKFPAPSVNKSWADHVIKTIFGGLARWDAQYFLHIAHYGYTYENTLAFFPVFPLLSRFLAYVLDSFAGFLINHASAVLLSSIMLNMLFFLNAASALFDLSCKVLENDKIAYIATLFFCINPASIFFTAPYSESCFAFFAFKGMLLYVNNVELVSSCALGLAGCVRSNGIVNFGFIVHKTIKNIIQYVNPSQKVFSVLYFIVFEIFKLCIFTVILLVPFLVFQLYAYTTFCLGNAKIPTIVKEFGHDNNFVMPGSVLSVWCNYSVPFSYTYVQNHYWNVGFFKYYQLKQIPNFLLALPMVYLVFTQTYSFMLQNKSTLISLGFNKVEFVRFAGKNVRSEFFVFAVHALFLTVFCLFFINVQVTTRMIASSCPVVYWYISLKYKTLSDSVQQIIPSRLNNLQKSHKYTFVETQENLRSFWKSCIITDKPANTWSYFVRAYFCLYLLIGTLLFSNSYPWT